MSRRRGQPLDDRSYQDQQAGTQRTIPAHTGATFYPSSDDQYMQPFEIQAAEEHYPLQGTPPPPYLPPQGNPNAARTQRTERKDSHQPAAYPRNTTAGPRTNEPRFGGEIPGFANRGQVGDNRRPPPSPILTGRVHKTEVMARRSSRNVGRSCPNYAENHKTSPLGHSISTRSSSRPETKKLAGKTARGMQAPDNSQARGVNRSNIRSNEIKGKMDKASMTRMATAARLFHENRHAKPYFHNVWHEAKNAAGQVERHAKKVLFFGHLDNIEDVSAVISPDRRYFLLRQEEIDQKADVKPISWAGFSADPRLRVEDGRGAINYQAVMELMSKDRAGGGRVTKHGRTLRLLERRDELDVLTPDEREKVFNSLRKNMPVTPVTPRPETKGHDGKSGFFHRSSKRDKTQKKLVEKWERGMLSNEQVKKLQGEGVLPALQRSRPERKAKGPVAALYEHDWQAHLYPNEKKLSRKK